MLTNTPSSWPEDSYRRIIRELWRQKNYVPPAQPNSAGLQMAALRTEPRADEQAPTRYGGWVLNVNEHGDLIARHDSGHEVVVAALPKEANSDG